MPTLASRPWLACNEGRGQQQSLQATLPGEAFLGLLDTLNVRPQPLAVRKTVRSRGSALRVLGPLLLCGLLREPERWRVQCVERRQSLGRALPGAWDTGKELRERISWSGVPGMSVWVLAV